MATSDIIGQRLTTDLTSVDRNYRNFILRTVECYDCNPQYNRALYEPSGEHFTLTMLTSLLDAALHMWDQDRVAAKSQISVAAAMLHGSLTQPQPSQPYAGGLAP